MTGALSLRAASNGATESAPSEGEPDLRQCRRRAPDVIDHGAARRGGIEDKGSAIQPAENRHRVGGIRRERKAIHQWNVERGSEGKPGSAPPEHVQAKLAFALRESNICHPDADAHLPVGSVGVSGAPFSCCQGEIERVVGVSLIVPGPDFTADRQIRPNGKTQSVECSAPPRPLGADATHSPPRGSRHAGRRGEPTQDRFRLSVGTFSRDREEAEGKNARPQVAAKHSTVSPPERRFDFWSLIPRPACGSRFLLGLPPACS
jgi:hypothetical protein